MWQVLLFVSLVRCDFYGVNHDIVNNSYATFNLISISTDGKTKVLQSLPFIIPFADPDGVGIIYIDYKNAFLITVLRKPPFSDKYLYLVDTNGTLLTETTSYQDFEHIYYVQSTKSTLWMTTEFYPNGDPYTVFWEIDWETTPVSQKQFATIDTGFNYFAYNPTDQIMFCIEITFTETAFLIQFDMQAKKIISNVTLQDTLHGTVIYGVMWDNTRRVLYSWAIISNMVHLAIVDVVSGMLEIIGAVPSHLGSCDYFDESAQVIYSLLTDRYSDRNVVSWIITDPKTASTTVIPLPDNTGPGFCFVPSHQY
eukprot:TRINITY_DN3063_c0_g1_i1.p1 TRINITY_DN3063_c0_g1~~TRINITY_DN3063_c0_g1_i1.p1  ORF type:complete len:310 (-),score=23.62 TRINITY_DN3063_c0_g1_i1:98-1027(-)